MKAFIMLLAVAAMVSAVALPPTPVTYPLTTLTGKLTSFTGGITTLTGGLTTVTGSVTHVMFSEPPRHTPTGHTHGGSGFESYMSKHSSLHPSHGHAMGTGDHHPHTYTVTGTGPQHSHIMTGTYTTVVLPSNIASNNSLATRELDARHNYALVCYNRDGGIDREVYDICTQPRYGYYCDSQGNMQYTFGILGCNTWCTCEKTVQAASLYCITHLFSMMCQEMDGGWMKMSYKELEKGVLNGTYSLPSNTTLDDLRPGPGPHHSSHVTEHYSPTTTTVATLTDASGVQTFSVAVGARDEGHPSGPWMHPTGSESWGPHGSAVKSWLSEHSGHWTATGTGKESHGSTASNQGPPDSTSTIHITSTEFVKPSGTGEQGHGSTATNQGPPDSTSTIHTTSTEFVSVKPSGTGHLPRDEDQNSKSTGTAMASSGNHTSHSARGTLSSLKSHTTNNPIVGPGPVSHTKSHTTNNPIGGPGPVSHTKSHTTEHHSAGPGSMGTSLAVREESIVTFHVGPGHLTSRPTRTTLMTSTCTESSVDLTKPTTITIEGISIPYPSGVAYECDNIRAGQQGADLPFGANVTAFLADYCPGF